MSNIGSSNEFKAVFITSLVLFGILLSYLIGLITLSSKNYQTFTFAFTLLVAMGAVVVLLIAETLLLWKMVELFV